VSGGYGMCEDMDMDIIKDILSDSLVMFPLKWWFRFSGLLLKLSVLDFLNRNQSDFCLAGFNQSLLFVPSNFCGLSMKLF
jgi:hypothetical protein